RFVMTALTGGEVVNHQFVNDQIRIRQTRRFQGLNFFNAPTYDECSVLIFSAAITCARVGDKSVRSTVKSDQILVFVKAVRKWSKRQRINRSFQEIVDRIYIVRRNQRHGIGYIPGLR